MAICSKCSGALGHTATVCPHCAYDFAEAVVKPTLFTPLTKLFWFCVLVGAIGWAVHSKFPNIYKDVTFKPFRSYFGQSLPELAPDNVRLGSTEPLSLGRFKGKAVWIQFSFMQCGGCLEMTKNLNDWHRQYSEQGLVIVEVFNGAVDEMFEQGAGAQVHVEQYAKKENIPFILVHDEHGKSCEAFGVRGCPVGYLVDPSGKVVWEDAPHGNEARVERKIRKALGMPVAWDYWIVDHPVWSAGLLLILGVLAVALGPVLFGRIWWQDRASIQ
jgi:peroxiredoxin